MIEPAVIDRADADELDVVDERDVIAVLADRGAVVFRGFGADVDQLTRFSDRFSDRFTCDPTKIVVSRWQGAAGRLGRAARGSVRVARRILPTRWSGGSAGGARFAPFGGFGINPHTENSFLPAARPDLVWFLCERSATSGGESILVDGSEALDALDADAATFLRDNPIRYTTELQPHEWRAAWGLDDIDAVGRLIDDVDGAACAIRGHGTVEITYDAPQVGPMLLGEGEALQTNLLSRQPFGSVNERSAESLPDGTRVPMPVMRSLLDAAGDQRLVSLDAGDVLLIDNTRVMHGRRPFDDPLRRVVTRCGWLRSELYAAHDAS